MHSLWLDLRHASRALLRAPAVTLAAALSIGLATGAATSVFSWLDGLVLHPFPAVPDQSRLVGIEVGPPNGGMGAWSYQTFRELRDACATLFDGVAAWRIIRVSAREAGETAPTPLLATTVSGRYFEVLRIRPAAGRLIGDADVDGASHVAVLGFEFWTSRYQRDAGVIGRTLLLNGVAVQVVGVAPPAFAGVYTGVMPHLYVPLTLQPQISGVNTLDDRKLRSWLMFARLKPGTTIDQIRPAADAAALRISTSYGDRPATGAVADDLRVEFLGRTLSPLFTAMLWIAIVLGVLASANVAGLLLVKADARRAEIALRRALGATRWRIARAVLIESALIASIGAVIGVGAAEFTRGVLYSLVPRGVFALTLPVPIGWRVLAWALAVAVVVTIVAGVTPALTTMGSATHGSLTLGARGAAGGRRTLRSAIVSGQLALCVLALVIAGMFVRGARSAAGVDVGFSDPAHVMLVDTDFGAARLNGADGVAALDRLLTRLRALPGVSSATVASMVPLGFGGRRIVEVRVEGYAPAAGENMSAERAHVGSDYATTMRIAIVSGRDLQDGDRAGTQPVAMVNQAFVARFFQGRDPIGRRVDAGNGLTTIVGVLHDGKYDRLDEPLHPVIYVPTEQWFLPGMTIHVRTATDPVPFADAVRRELAAIHPDLAALQPRTLAEHISASTFVPRTGATVIGSFALMALALSIVGLYGALAFAVALRRREIAIRVALGAARRSVAWAVARHAMGVTLAGAAGGVVLTLVGAPILRRIVSGLGPSDMSIALATAAALGVVTIVAAWGPARRALRVDPVTALRGD